MFEQDSEKLMSPFEAKVFLRSPIPEMKLRVPLLMSPGHETLKDYIELDYKLLVLGDFSHAEREKPKDDDETPVNRRLWEIRSTPCFQRVLEDIKPQLNITVPCTLPFNDCTGLPIKLTINSLKDFHPDEVVKNVQVLQELLNSRKRLTDFKVLIISDPKIRKLLSEILEAGSYEIHLLINLLENRISNNKLQHKTVEFDSATIERLIFSLPSEEMTAAVLEFFLQVMRKARQPEYVKLDRTMIDSYISDIDNALSTQMDEILHHEEFQSLEAAWRGLHFLVQNAEFSKPIKIEVLDISKAELLDDLQANSSFYKDGSALGRQIYWPAFPEVLHPFTAIISDYQFDNSDQDVNLLRQLSMLCERAQVPFIGNVSPKFFGVENFSEIMNLASLSQKINGAEQYSSWRSFRTDERSKYLGLTLPRFLGRLPYSPDGARTKNFNYKENIAAEKKEHWLWIHSAFLLGSNMLRCFERWGWSVKVAGVDSACYRIDLDGQMNLKTVKMDSIKLVKDPAKRNNEVDNRLTETIEILIGTKKFEELCAVGFIPLVFCNQKGHAGFLEAPSIQQLKINEGDAEATSKARIHARLQYTFLITRMAQYLKHWLIRLVGRTTNANEIQESISGLLNGFVSDFPNPPMEVIARRPLRSYQIEVTRVEDNPRFHQITAELRPHIAIIGEDVWLKMGPIYIEV